MQPPGTRSHDVVGTKEAEERGTLVTLCCCSEAQGSSAGGQTRRQDQGGFREWDRCWPPACMFYRAAGGRLGEDVRMGCFLSPLGPRQVV